MKPVIAILLASLVALQYQLWLGDRGMPEVHRLEAEVERRVEDNARLEARNRRLAAEVHDLKEGLEAVEERARTDLGMIGRTRPTISSSNADRRFAKASDLWAVVPAAGLGRRFAGDRPSSMPRLAPAR